MQSIHEFLNLLLNSEDIVTKGGLVLITLIVFAESGIFFCFFLPGDYLLFSAGLFAGTGILKVSYPTLAICLVGAAIAGNYFGYLFGKFLGHTFETRKENFFFKKRYITNTKTVFEKYGGSALIISRFLPIIRTFAPLLAGIVQMRHRVFVVFNVLGALAWVLLLTGTSYFLGHTYGKAMLDLLPWIIGGFLVFTTFAVVNSALKLRRDAEAAEKAKADLNTGQ